MPWRCVLVALWLVSVYVSAYVRPKGSGVGVGMGVRRNAPGLCKHVWMRRKADQNDDNTDDTPRQLHSLKDLKAHIDKLLEETQKRESANNYQRNEKQYQDTSDIFHTVVVFGKHLVRDQVTVEYASRIRTLVKGLKNGKLKPNLICFTGGQSGTNHVPDASAGYIFFRHMCEHQGVCLDSISFFVESKSSCSKEAVANVVAQTKRYQQQAETIARNRRAKKGLSTDKMPSVLSANPFGILNDDVSYHFTLISSDYHLNRIDNVHRLSSRRSLLSPLMELGASYEYEYATYPYVFSKDATTSFLARTLLVVEELVPVLVNLEGIVDTGEFLAMSNFDTLEKVRNMLFEQLGRIHDQRSPLRIHTLKMSVQALLGSGTGAFDNAPNIHEDCIDDVLQRAITNLRTVQTVLQPLTQGKSFGNSRTDIRSAVGVLVNTIQELRAAVDPDRPLRPREWGVLVTDASSRGKERSANHNTFVDILKSHFSPSSHSQPMTPLEAFQARPVHNHPAGYWSTIDEEQDVSLYDEVDDSSTDAIWTSETLNYIPPSSSYQSTQIVNPNPNTYPGKPIFTAQEAPSLDSRTLSHTHSGLPASSLPPVIHGVEPIKAHVAQSGRRYGPYVGQNFDPPTQAVPRPPVQTIHDVLGLGLESDANIPSYPPDEKVEDQTNKDIHEHSHTHEEEEVGFGAVRARPAHRRKKTRPNPNPNLDTAVQDTTSEEHSSSSPVGLARVPQGVDGAYTNTDMHTHTHPQLHTYIHTPSMNLYGTPGPDVTNFIASVSFDPKNRDKDRKKTKSKISETKDSLTSAPKKPSVRAKPNSNPNPKRTGDTP